MQVFEISSKKWWTYVDVVVVFLVLVANVFVFLIVPNERHMGAVQRIFYFHVGSAFACYVVIGLLFLASVLYLSGRDLRWDALAEALGSVGLLFCSIVLASGMIWGQSAWNTWWRWEEPRLVSFLVLWFIMLSYVLLRSSAGALQTQARLAAILGIVAAVNIPIVIFSIELLDQSAQLHPQVIGRQGLRDWRFVVGLIVSTLAMIGVALSFVRFSVRNAALKRQLARVEARVMDAEE